ncbi:hypothetical protein PIB30_003614 [Stylosanthes scabra]|uniref:Uncharacterized protein n=1 Tax=Stylosanthes scabra TaxID=79078 RepID=A0ABU6Y0R0_9FABA|nr:hypothetical protein [Stylosanthes scabra]
MRACSIVKLIMIAYKRNPMAKNNGVVTLAIAMLIIGMVVCFAKDDESIYNIAIMNDYLSDTMMSCLTHCHTRHPHNPVKRKKCLEECCNAECRDLNPHDKEMFEKCNKHCYGVYVR